MRQAKRDSANNSRQTPISDSFHAYGPDGGLLSAVQGVPGPLIQGNPFDEARRSCALAASLARHVTIDGPQLQAFARVLDPVAVRNVMSGGMGENCDTFPEEFEDARDSVNFAVLFSLLQFGHGFRHELHKHCGRGASKTITLGTRRLRASGNLNARRLAGISLAEVRQAFGLPENDDLDPLAQQLLAVIHQAGTALEEMGHDDFYGFCRNVLAGARAEASPTAALVREMANGFPAFNDQPVLYDGTRVVLVKKATLAAGEMRRLAGMTDQLFSLSADYDQAIAPVDNVIPAMLVYHGVLRLSSELHRVIHQERTTLDSGPAEAELRAVALAACEQIVSEAGRRFTSLELGYFLWRSGKTPGAREFPRHHTKDTIFY